MLGDPLEKLRHGVDLVVEMAVRELDHLVDEFGDPRGRPGQRYDAAADSIAMLMQSAHLIFVRCVKGLPVLTPCWNAPLTVDSLQVGN